MPPVDERLTPDLERAMPADSVVYSGWEMVGNACAVLFRDGAWRSVVVLARWLDMHGRPVVQVEYYAEGAGWTESFIANREKMRG